MAHKSSGGSKSALTSTLLLCLLTLVLTFALGLSVVYRMKYPPTPKEEVLAPLPTTPAKVWPEPVVVADGQPGSLLCLDSYTALPEASKSGAKRTVATLGEAELTGGELQIYYLNAIATYLRSGSEEVPDLSQPLEQQLCPLGEGNLSWQHYFLQQALDTWQTETLLLQAAQEPRYIQEEAFKPNETDDLHGKYVAEDLPVNDFLYGDQDCYTPNSMHQAYLDGLKEQMDALAKELGFADLADYAKTVLGSGVSAQALVEAAQRYNTAYMFFTEESYDITITDEDIDKYLKANAKKLVDVGPDTVDMRHMLLIPAGAKVAKDGTVKATKDQWADCEKQAQEILQSWKQDYLNGVMGKEANFARLANQMSADGGSKLNGGLYQNIQPGQLIDALDEWCFDEARQPGDTAIIRSALGDHIVFFSGWNDSLREAARQALTQSKELERWQKLKAENPLKVNYSAIQLWADCREETVLPVDVLYPDIAHERFPEAIVYFQQDYMYTPYGGSYVGRGGCGITTMAMLATYMTDTIYTPAMLAERYPEYHDASGTRGELFRYVPAELGFFLEDTTAQIGEVIAALKNGQRVVSLQHLGHFTSGGHYLLLQQYYEESDTFQVRDSNIYNYGRLSGHKVDYFTRADILSGSATFYIMQNKITRIPACCRCGSQSQPEKLLQQDYLCPKCAAALSRRNSFLALMGQPSGGSL